MQYEINSLEVIGVNEICEILDCSRNTVYSLLSENPEDTDKIKAWRIGNRWKCSRAALNQYIMKQSSLSY